MCICWWMNCVHIRFLFSSQKVLCAVAWYALYGLHAVTINRYLCSSQRRFVVTSSMRKHDWNGDRMKLCVFSLNNTEFGFVQLAFIGSLCLSHMIFYAQVVNKSVLWPDDSYENYSNQNFVRKIFLLFFSFYSPLQLPHFFPVMSSGSFFFIFLGIVIFFLILMWHLPFFVLLFFSILS